jgi:lactoylglutathione lyase
MPTSTNPARQDAKGFPAPREGFVSAHVLTSALNIRVADIQAVYREWKARGAEFLTEPKDHGGEIRCYLRDPDGHLIELGQATGILRQH